MKVAQLEQPSCPDSRDVKCEIETVEYFVNKMCACKDKACAGLVSDEMTNWRKERSKNAPDNNLDPTDQMHLDAVISRLPDCITKAMLAPSPPSAPAPGDPPKCRADDTKCFTRGLESWSDMMCACKDARCARAVGDRLQTWGSGMGKSAQKPDPADTQRATGYINRYADCMKQLFMGDTPPPGPVGS